MNEIKANKSLPAFLMDSKYRICRHLLVIIIVATISFNQVFIAYQDCQTALGTRIYLICLPSFLLYLSALYFNYYYLFPRLFLKGKYIFYLVILSLIVFSLLLLSLVAEYWVRNSLDLPHRVSSYTNPLILFDSLASFILNLICFFSLTITQLFRKWIADNEEISRLEYTHLRFELNKLKGQIAPKFLSTILNKASNLVKTNPTKSNNMLMLLGRILRYQLYDCNRDKVLLSADINNISCFLKLVKTAKEQFEYNILEEGKLINIFVPPLLFSPIIQCVINNSCSIKLSFCIKDNTLLFGCKSDNNHNIEGYEFDLIRERLVLLFPHNHALYVGKGLVELQIKLSESWMQS